MSLVEFFFNPDYREWVYSKNRSNKSIDNVIKHTLKDKLKEGECVIEGNFYIYVQNVNDADYYGIIYKQNGLSDNPHHRSFVNTGHLFKRYDEILAEDNLNHINNLKKHENS